MSTFTGLKCDGCGQIYDGAGAVQDFCPECGPRFGTLDCRYDYDLIKKYDLADQLKKSNDWTLTRYSPLLPLFHPTDAPPLRVGFTPLYDWPKMAGKMGLENIYLKDDSLSPSLSYKDRASFVVVARAEHLKYSTVACASTGNAAASVSAMCAAKLKPCIVFVPESAPSGKLVQIASAGARLITVMGSYDQAFDLAMHACKRFGWFNRSAGLNPYLVEGKKTGALEVAEQLDFNIPDSVFVSVGDGSIISGLCKGFRELKILGLTDRLPKIFGVQAEGCSILVDSYKNFLETGDIDFCETETSTLADSINVANPREGVRAIRNVAECNGSFIAVSDDAILHSMKILGSQRGIFAEPAAATAFAGLRKAIMDGIVNPGERVAVFLTGSGLKDIKAAEIAAKMEKITIHPYIEELDRLETIL